MLFYSLYTLYGGAMALSIRNPRAEKLAREVAAESGENLTQAIIQALEERLERLRGRRTTTDVAHEIMKISQRCSGLPDLDQRAADEILGYDHIGIPQ
jgi:antitoxin VapB